MREREVERRVSFEQGRESSLGASEQGQGTITGGQGAGAGWPGVSGFCRLVSSTSTSPPPSSQLFSLMLIPILALPRTLALPRLNRPSPLPSRTRNNSARTGLRRRPSRPPRSRIARLSLTLSDADEACGSSFRRLRSALFVRSVALRESGPRYTVTRLYGTVHAPSEGAFTFLVARGEF